MESYTVCQLQKDMRFEGFLLVRSAEKRKDVKGNDYVDMNLTDRTGEINCKIWNWESSAEMPENGSVVKIRGTVQEYNGRLQLRVERWRKAAAEDPVDMNRLVPCAPRKAEDMTAEIRETVESFRSEKLRKLTMGMLENAGGDLSWFPAAQRMHHAERSGLLHHTTDMLRMAKAMLEVYPWLNRDLLLAGVIIHDLGKMLRHILFVKMPAREVDRDRHRFDIQLFQPFKKPAHHLDHVPIQHGDGAGLLHRGQKLLRQDHVAVFPHPTDQGFGGLHSAGRGVDLWLIIYFQFLPAHRLHSVQDVADDIIVHFFLSVPPAAFFDCAQTVEHGFCLR